MGSALRCCTSADSELRHAIDEPATHDTPPSPALPHLHAAQQADGFDVTRCSVWRCEALLLADCWQVAAHRKAPTGTGQRRTDTGHGHNSVIAGPALGSVIGMMAGPGRPSASWQGPLARGRLALHSEPRLSHQGDATTPVLGSAQGWTMWRRERAGDAIRLERSDEVRGRLASESCLARRGRHAGGRSDWETDGTKTNLGVARLLEVTENPRNRSCSRPIPAVDVTPG